MYPMRSAFKFVVVALLVVCLRPPLGAQDLAPRAYLITPVHSNAVTLSYSYSNGDIDVGGSVPITGATGKVNLSIVSLFHSLSFLGRSTNVTVSLPYVITNYRGEVIGSDTSVRRSGLMDVVIRFSVNIKGAPAMEVEQ